MLDIKKIREEKEKVEKALLKRLDSVSLDEIIKLDNQRRELINKKEGLQHLRNKTSRLIIEIKKNGEDVSDYVINMRLIGEEISLITQQIFQIEQELFIKMAELPNIPDEDVLAGDKENNTVLFTYLTTPKFSFIPKDHIDISAYLGLIDYQRGVKLAGPGNWIYTNKGAQLEFALINYFVSEHLNDNWEFMMIPHMLKYDCGFIAGQFPKFKDDIYWIDEDVGRVKFMLPTAETGLVSIHRDEILSEEDLPKKYFSYTPCFRREAGSSRKEERGIIRGHQFNKVELVQYTTENDSNRAFEEMVEKAKSLIEKLGLHYRIVKLAAKDCSTSMARTYDIEVWIPSMGIYKEVSSISNAREYQARRGNMKFKDSLTGKTRYLHTLNGSALATSRLFPAILEQYQQLDGSVVIPDVLKPYMGNQDKIEAKGLTKKL